ncbi:MAG: trehalose-phosphatase [Bacteroidota bacterium]
MVGSPPGPPPLARSNWAYFLDFDGTLVELAVTPDAIHVDPLLPALLADLHRRCAGAVALVSGRALADLDRHIAIADLPKAGQHGMERRDASGRLWRHALPPHAKQAIRAKLVDMLEQQPGLLLEDKGLTLALHYRQAPELGEQLRHLLELLVAEADAGLTVQAGKCVVEVRPAGIDKGTAVREYLAEPPFQGRRPVFVGDDRSDEHAFVAVNELGGVSVGVGSGSLSARYRLADVSAVRAWLTGVVSGRP